MPNIEMNTLNGLYHEHISGYCEKFAQRMGIEFLECPIKEDSTVDIPILVMPPGGVTRCNNGTNAFTLTSAIAPEWVYVNTPVEQLILRMNFSYADCMTATNSLKHFRRMFKDPIEQACLRLMQENRILPGDRVYGKYFLKALDAGYGSYQYFIDMNNAPGFELRFSSFCTKLRE